MTEKRKNIKILSIVSICIVAAIAVALRILGLVGKGKNVSATDIGLFISSLIIFTAAIILSVTGKELAGMIIVLFAETIPATSAFIWAARVSGQPFGDVIKNNPYEFASFFILIYLIIVLALILRYKTSDRVPITRKWAFIPVIVTFLFLVIFQAVNWNAAGGDAAILSVRFSTQFIGTIIAITAAIGFNAYVSGSLITFAVFLLIPFHLRATLAVKKSGHDGYMVSYWSIGLLFLAGSIAWLIYEIYYYFAVRRKKGEKSQSIL